LADISPHLAVKKDRSNTFFKWALSHVTDHVHSGPYGKNRPVVGNHEVLAGTTPGVGSDFSDWASILEIFAGFANATQITFGENRTECQFSIETFYQSAVDATNVLTQDGTLSEENPMNYFDFWLALDMYLTIPHKLHDAYYSCYMSVIEIYELMIMYTQFSYNLDILYFNMIYNAGSVIKGISNIVMYFYAKEYTRVSDGFTLGLELGQIIWMIFYPTAEYL